MISMDVLSQYLDPDDRTTDYFLFHRRSRGEEVPGRFLRPCRGGKRRNRKEVRAHGSYVRRMVKKLQRQELENKAQQRLLRQIAAKEKQEAQKSTPKRQPKTAKTTAIKPLRKADGTLFTGTL